MATKAQDKKALEQIKQILAGLDGDSYVLQAMDGMVEDAERNIENDAWDSYRSRFEYVQAMSDRLDENLVELQEKNRELEGKLDAAKRDAQQGAEAATAREQELELEIIKLKAKLYDMMVGA